MTVNWKSDQHCLWFGRMDSPPPLFALGNYLCLLDTNRGSPVTNLTHGTKEY